MEVNKARNLLEHGREIFSRPPRTWIQQPRPGKRPPPSQPPSADQPRKKKHAKKPAQDEDVRFRTLSR